MNRLLVFAVITLLCQAAMAHPSTTTIIVPYPPGGGTDITARAYAEVMRKSLNRPVIVENRPGAGGLAGAAFVANARPDGSVILLGNVFINVLAALTHRHLQFDPAKTLAPISMLARTDIGLAVGPSVQAKTLKEFVAWAKANPQKSVYGNPAAGSLPYFFGMLFARDAGIDLRPVQYKGSPSMNNDLMAGRIASVTNAVTDLVPLHTAGRIRMLATGGDERLRATPDVPTFSESGYPDIRGTSWFALFAPSATPADEIGQLSRAVQAAGADPRVRKAIEAIGIDVATSSPEALGRLIVADHTRWAPVVKASGFTAD